MIFNLSFNHILPDDAIIIDCTSNSSSFGRLLSPFNVGPVDLYGNYVSETIENAYQYSKLYPKFMDEKGHPSPLYFEWANAGWQSKVPNKYPMGAWNHSDKHWWDGKFLTRKQAQNEIFVPLYAKAVVKTEAYLELKNIFDNAEQDIILLDYEGYNHRTLEMSYNDVINHEHWPIGQGFALCMLLEEFYAKI